MTRELRLLFTSFNCWEKIRRTIFPSLRKFTFLWKLYTTQIAAPINKGCLEGIFFGTTAELTPCNRDPVAWNIYRKSLLTPVQRIRIVLGEKVNFYPIKGTFYQSPGNTPTNDICEEFLEEVWLLQEYPMCPKIYPNIWVYFSTKLCLWVRAMNK